MLTGLSGPGRYGKPGSSVAAWHVRPRTPQFPFAPPFCSELLLKLSNCTSAGAFLSQRPPPAVQGAATRSAHRTVPGPWALPGGSGSGAAR